MNLKILIIAYYFPPKNAIASLRPYSWAKYWSQWGHDVTVLTADQTPDPNDLNLSLEGFQIIKVSLPVFIQGLIKRFKKKKLDEKENPYSNRPVDSKSKILASIKEKFGIFQTVRMPDHTDFLFYKGYKAVSDTNWDVVVSSFGPYVSHLIAAKLKRKNKVRFWVADYRDLWTENAYYKGVQPFKLIEKYLEGRVNQSADLITSVSSELVERLKQRNKNQNIETIFNGFDPSDHSSNDRHSIDLNSKNFNIVYTGSIYPKTQNPSPLFRAIKSISSSNQSKFLNKLKIWFIGHNMEYLSQTIDLYSVSDWVNCSSQISRELALEYQKKADIVLFLESDRKENRGVLTGKLFEYLFSGTKIWGVGITKNCAPGKLIEDSGCGISFGNNYKLIQEHLLKDLQSGVKPKTTPRREIVSQYTREEQAKKLIELIELRI